jgi:uncharacterized protein
MEVAMKKWIEDLLALQKVDMRVRNLKIKLATLPVERKRIEADRQAASLSVKAAKESLQQAELQMKKADQSIAEINAEARKLQTQSAMVKKNSEYQAMMSQIDQCKLRISDVETEQIGLLDKIEERKNLLRDAEKEFADKERSLKSELSEFVQLEAEIKEEMAQLLASRRSFESKLETSVLTVYNRLAANGKGLPLASVGSGGHCSNCQLKLTPQTINQAKNGDLVCCDNCSHIVFIDA